MARPAPIAVVGMGCRLPGGASTPEKFWDLMKEGQSGWARVPKDRWNADSFYHPDNEHRESLNAQSAYFLKEDVSRFDAPFFNITSYEAHTMDPQGRLLLETTYEALESAGIPVESIKGSDTSVFVGVFGRDYDRMGYKDIAQISRAQLTGTGEAILSNRISYVFDLKGASMTIDTGCSGSMVALHQACMTLRAGESRAAIVGGTELLLHPDQSITMSNGGMVNPDGKCYVFDNRGSGYARGEGAASVVLKLLEHAIEDGDPIHGVILNSALNQDGRTAGISLPNPEAQADLMRQVYLSAGVDPGETLYVEAHGTGTQAGDNAEVSSISQIFCDESNTRKTDLYIGSVKSNIGHLEAASGVSGLIKTILVLKNGQVPPHLDFETPKPILRLDERRLKIAKSLVPLAPEGHTGPRRVSVNSFGYGGTNCHVVLESVQTAVEELTTNPAVFNRPTTRMANGLFSAITNGNGLNEHSSTNGVNGHSRGPKKLIESLTKAVTSTVASTLSSAAAAANGADKKKPRPLLFTISAASETAAQATTKNLASWLATKKENAQQEELSYTDLQNLSFTLSQRRTLHPYRSAFVASTHDELIAELTQGSGVKPVKSRAGTSSIQLAFVFTGQGAQWFAMGRELLSSSAVFRRSLEASDAVLRTRGCTWSLITELTKPEAESLVGRSEVSQPATTAIQLALVDLLADLGITPKAVVGHSSGEIAAAYAAGALTHEAAMTASYCRGVYSARAKTVNTIPGSMLAVGASEEAIAPLAKQASHGKIRVACVNSPDSVTVSGDEAAIDELQQLLQGRDVFARKLKVDTAYHSHHMEAIAKEYRGALESYSPSGTGAPREGVTFYSSVTGKEKTSGFDAAYWTQNLISQVRFSDALSALAEGMSNAARNPSNVFVEIGPHAALMGPLRQTLAKRADYKYSYFSCLHRNQDAAKTALSVVARLFELGSPVDLEKVLSLDASSTRGVGQEFKTLTELPPYAWDHGTSYWLESRLSRDHRLRKYPYHDLLGLFDVASNIHEPRWRYHISVKSIPWIKHHVVDNMIVFPGAAYITMAIEGMKQLSEMRNPTAEIAKFCLQNVAFTKPVMLKEEGLDGSTPEVELQLVLTRSRTSESSPWENFRILSYDADGTWSDHASGSIRALLKSAAQEDVEGIPNEEALRTKAAEAKYAAIKKASSIAVESDDVYAMLRSTGNDFGPSFTTLSGIEFSKECSGHGIVKIANVPEWMSKGFMQPHVIHPVTLDAVYQLPAIMFKRECSNAPLMPTFMKEIVISNNIAHAPGAELFVATEITPEGKASASGNSWVFQKKSGSSSLEVVSHTTAWQLRGIGEEVRDTETAPFHRKMNYRIEWEEDMDLLTEEQVQKRIYASVSENESQAAHEALELSEAGAAIFLRNAYHKVRPNAHRITTPHYVKLYKWTEDFLQSEMYRNAIASIGNEPEESVLHRLVDIGVEGKMLTQIGTHLAEILVGEIEPLALMLEDNLLNRVYAETVLASNEHMAKYVQLLAHKKPHMAILEIGAGTGGSTLPMLQHLDRPEGPLLETYHYTDISSGFFEQAKTKFAAWDGYMEFKTLDVTKDPLKQGFEAGKYDLIMCSNVLHATPSMDVTLSNTRKLLKPGGRLVLVELTRLTAAVNTIFGTLPGWWAFEDERTKYNQGPLMSRSLWHELLSRHSFNGVEVAIDDHLGPTPRGAVMVSKAIEEAAPQPSTNKTVHIISTSPSAVSNSIAKGIVTATSHCGINSTSEVWDVHRSNEINENTVYIVLDRGDKSILASPGSEESFDKLKTLVTSCKSLLWVSLQEDSSPYTTALKGLITGFARVVRRENDGVRFITLDIASPVGGGNVESVVTAAMNVAETSFWPKAGNRIAQENEYRLHQDGKLSIPRAQADTNFNNWVDRMYGESNAGQCVFQDPSRPLRLEVETPGLLTSLRFTDDESHRKPLAPDEIQIEARAYGVNFRDVFIALGQMLPGLPMAGECAGVVTHVGADFKGEYKVGDRVMGLGAQAFASHPRLNGLWAHALPATLDLGFDAAASMPIIFLTAYHCLIDIAHLKKGQTVLIQAASGGVGQAAIQLAQWVGAEIYATVGSAEKRDLVMNTYGIPATHIFSSRDTSFKDGVMRVTNGRGVDVVLNSLAGEMLTHSWECVAPLGYHVEIGKADIYKRSHLSMTQFNKNVTFAAIDLMVLFAEAPRRMYQTFGEVVKLIEQGVLREVTPLMTMNIDHIEQSFRLIAGRKHRGKVILNIPEKEPIMVKATLPPPPALKLSQDGAYVIAGGLGDLGRRIARVLASHGAGHIVTLSRRDLDPEAKQQIESDIQSLGGRLHIVKCDITSKSSVEAAAKYCQRNLPPVRGIIHGGMVLRDRPVAGMKLDDHLTALGPKVTGTLNLDFAFQSANLDFFIMLSSVTCILGKSGQANYASGNSFQDAFAHAHPQTPGRPSGTRYISINLGAVDGSEAIIAMGDKKKDLIRASVFLMSFEEVFKALEYLMGPQAAQDASVQSAMGFDRQSIMDAEDEFSMQNPILSMVPHTRASQAAGGSGDGKVDLQAAIKAAKSIKEAEEVIIGAIVEKFAVLLDRPVEDVNLDLPLANFGMDSLVSIEIKNWMGRSFEVAISAAEVTNASSIPALAEMIALRSKLISDAVRGEAGSSSSHSKRETPGEGQDDTATGDVKAKPNGKTSKAAHGYSCCAHSQTLCRQPIANLKSSVEYFFSNASRFAKSPQELENFKAAVKAFTAEGSTAHQIYKQLAARAADSSVDSWGADIITEALHLETRSPLMHKSFCGTHFKSAVPHTQAERAALLAAVTFQHKQDLEAGVVESAAPFGVPLCMYWSTWLFNSTREPHIGVDKMRKYEGDYCVVLRHGRVFKVSLKDGAQNASVQQLEETFQRILDESPDDEPDASIGLLTSDNRDSWAKNREALLKVDSQNALYLQTVEASAFIICLEDTEAHTGLERVQQCVQGDGSNRWYDKSVQLIVAKNGTSSFLMDHSMIDGQVMLRFNEAIHQAFREYQPNKKQQVNGAATNGTSSRALTELEEYSAITSPALQEAIETLREKHRRMAAQRQYARHSIESINAKMLTTFRSSAKTILDVVVQLATRLYFGYNPACWEAINMARFHKGRPDMIQQASEPVAAFCTAVLDGSRTKSELRKMMIAASEDITDNATRAARGESHYNLMMAIKALWPKDQKLPEIYTDAVFARAQPHLIISGVTDEEGAQDKAYQLVWPEAFWVLYAILDDRCVFNIVGPVNGVPQFEKCLDDAGEIIKSLILAGGA